MTGLILLLIAQEDLATNRDVLNEIVASKGKTIAIDDATDLGRFLRAFNLVPAGAKQVAVDQTLVAKAEGVYAYFARPSFYEGQQILVVDSATGWITHRATIKEALPGDRFRVEVVEVVKYDRNMAPEQTRTVERILTHADVAELNAPRIPTGRNYNGIEFDPATDPALREWVDSVRRVIDENFPDFSRPASEVRAQQEKLFKKTLELVAVMEHSARPRYADTGIPLPDSHPFAKLLDRVRAQLGVQENPLKLDRAGRSALASKHFGGNQAGRYLFSLSGVCYEQAALQWWVLNKAGIRRAGIDISLVDGATLDGGGHGFNLARFRGDPKLYVTDISWNSDWELWRPADTFDENLLMKADEAFRDKGMDRNRRVLRLQGEKAPTRTVALSARTAARARAEAAGLGHFAAAFVIKETLKGNPREGLAQLREPGFWGSAALFSGAAKTAEWALKSAPRLARGTLPLAAGMAALQLLSGNYSAKDLLISTGSYLVAGALVNLAADALIYPILFAAGPPGWIAAGLYTVGKLAVTLYLGEKLEGWLHGLFGRKRKREGFVERLESMGEK